ncbi:MAG TPA: TolC family protein, partial [Candidatus Wallbacteria bacterium]|nr:TolC family protein [Candidatus Wallbacteria bacterium]
TSASMKLAKSGDKPTVALSGTYDQAKGKSYPVEKFNETWNMNVVAQVPLYDARESKHALETAATAYEQKKINFDQLIENVKLEVKIAHQELIQADELITASEKNVEQAKEALSIAQVSYDNGLNTNLEIMDAQLALTQAKTNYFQSLHDYGVAFAKLEKSMGIARIAE